MDRYESLLAIYQAQNAVQIARAQGAAQYAGDTLAKAEGLLNGEVSGLPTVDNNVFTTSFVYSF